MIKRCDFVAKAFANAGNRLSLYIHQDEEGSRAVREAFNLPALLSCASRHHDARRQYEARRLPSIASGSLAANLSVTSP